MPSRDIFPILFWFSNYISLLGLTKKVCFYFSQRLADDPQSTDYMNFNSAKLSEKLCETLRDMLFFYFLVSPSGVGFETPKLSISGETTAEFLKFQ
jgi:hypothetical protein